MRFIVLFVAALLIPRHSTSQPLVQRSFGELVVHGARDQIGKTLSYDGSYRKLKYPGGDPPIETGVCTDVVIRAFRKAGVDLQREVHLDMKGAFSQYPRIWGLRRPDRNIDHRRVPNLQRYFERKGAALSLGQSSRRYLPGDLVTWMLSGNLPHIGVVSDRRSVDTKRPLIIHNIGAGAKEEDVLHSYSMTGHYRFFR